MRGNVFACLLAAGSVACFGGGGRTLGEDEAHGAPLERPSRVDELSTADQAQLCQLYLEEKCPALYEPECECAAMATCEAAATRGLFSSGCRADVTVGDVIDCALGDSYTCAESGAGCVYAAILDACTYADS